MFKILGGVLLCVFSVAACAGAAQEETFVIRADAAGHEPIVKIPGGALMRLSANFAQSLAGGPDPQFESMRLSGDVSICIAGSTQPIQIKADDLVLELTADSLQESPKRSRSDAAAKVLRSTKTLPGEGDSKVFVGNVIFDLQTASGPMEIKADRVESHPRNELSRPAAGA